MTTLKAALFWMFHTFGVPADMLPCSDLPGGGSQVVDPGAPDEPSPEVDGPGRTRAHGDEPIYNGF